VGSAALGVAHATSGITANVLTSRWPTAFSRATGSILTYKVHTAKRWNKGNSGADHNVRLHKGTVHRGRCFDLDATPQEGMIFHSAGQASVGWRVLGCASPKLRPNEKSCDPPARAVGQNWLTIARALKGWGL